MAESEFKIITAANQRNWAIDRIIDGDYPTIVRTSALAALAVGAVAWGFGVEGPLLVAAESRNERVAGAAGKISELLGIGK